MAEQSFEPRAAGWEARTLPLCYAAPLYIKALLMCWQSEVAEIDEEVVVERLKGESQLSRKVSSLTQTTYQFKNKRSTPGG